MFDPNIAALLETPPIPYQVMHIWSWWLELHARRNTTGTCSIAWEAIYAFNKQRRLRMTVAEESLLLDVETEYMQYRAWRADPESKPKEEEA